MKHTPSPWINIGAEIRHKNTSLILANVYNHLVINQPIEERMANAKLMAAAPELLELLIQMADYYIHEKSIESEEWTEMIDSVILTIDKLK